METFDARQLACIASSTKTIWWKFHIVDNLSNNYYWSIQDVPDLVQAYTFNIVDFSGITLRRNKSESGIHAPNEVTFSIVNKDNTYTAANFKDGTVSISLVIDDGIGEETCGTWVFDIKSASPYNQQIDIVCVDFLQKYLKGSYPNTRNISDIFPSTDATPDDALCIPEIYGTAYIPLRSVYADGSRYYILGDTTKTYTISEVRMPRELGKQIWESPTYDFTQATKADGDATDWRMFQAMIADGSPGIFLSGTTILDLPTKLSTSDTASMTSPADIIEQVMLNMGVPAAYIDSSALTAAKAIYTSWGLEFNFAYYYKQDRTKVISQLLSMCHSYIEVGDKLRLKVLSKTPVKTITDSEVTKDDVASPPNFSYSDTVSEMTSDSGYIAYNVSGETQNELIKIIVPAKSTTYTIDSEIFECPAVQDSQDVQRIGTLRLQRKFLKMGDVDAKLKGTCLALRPDDVITIDDANFGGTYNVLVDEIKISYDATVDISCLKFS
ncbi:MAG: hypothetical protein PHX36_10775, partial [Mesotoga sp.]|uniref:hypothetical protein n=1 Tax=Mesotoga sp. TaxID=2053577 RepID=UPI0026165CAF